MLPIHQPSRVSGGLELQLKARVTPQPHRHFPPAGRCKALEANIPSGFGDADFMPGMENSWFNQLFGGLGGECRNL